MGVLTTLLKLLKPSENDYYNQQTEQADNWDKVDNYAVLTNTDKNGIWGGEYGGKIQDPIPKELNKRYIDNINGKAFICIKAGDSSVTSNTTEYFTPCNTVDNLGKLQNLILLNDKKIDKKIIFKVGQIPVPHILKPGNHALNQTISFDIPFDYECLMVYVIPGQRIDPNIIWLFANANSWNKNQFTYDIRNSAESLSDAQIGQSAVKYLAIGY